jgi:hypothetical protein
VGVSPEHTQQHPAFLQHAMMLALQLLGSGALASASSPPPSWLDPTYHFRRAANHMNDPNVRCHPAVLPQLELRSECGLTALAPPPGPYVDAGRRER